jgi:hypothetical protein
LSYLLIRFKDNWGDEMNVTGFVVVAKDDWSKMYLKVVALFEKASWEFYFGTNESIEYNNLAHWEENFTTVELTDEEFQIITTLFKTLGVRGIFDWPQFLLCEGFFPYPSPEEFAEFEFESKTA